MLEITQMTPEQYKKLVVVWPHNGLQQGKEQTSAARNLTDLTSECGVTEATKVCSTGLHLHQVEEQTKLSHRVRSQASVPSPGQTGQAQRQLPGHRQPSISSPWC